MGPKGYVMRRSDWWVAVLADAAVQQLLTYSAFTSTERCKANFPYGYASVDG